MALIVRDPELTNAPRAWAQCREYLSAGVYPTTIGFSCTRADLYRFRSRFRLAKSFRGLVLDGYATPETVNGYGSLFRAFLVWSAFEMFLLILDLDRAATGDLGKKHGETEVCSKIVAIQGHGSFLGFIRERLDSRAQQTQIDELIAGREADVSYVVSGIRHIFAHGELTPHAGAGDAATAQSVCDVVSDYLLNIMDQEFEEVVLKYKP